MSSSAPASPADDLADPISAAPVSARATTASQRERRRRILNAAVALARQGGYDAVQMREVADLAGVALGTLYRYFPSKVHLLAAAMVRQLEALHDQLLLEELEGEDERARVLGVIYRVIAALERDRLVSDALVRAMVVAGPDEVDQVNAVNSSIIATAIHGRGVAVSQRDFAVSLLIGKVLMTDLLGWLCGRMSIERVRSSLSDMVAVTMAGKHVLQETSN
jgi:TetR/AcrR family transcriptional regulator, cholesterol catabolism regulator